MTEKTHYRRAFNSPYLSSADLVGPTVLTISHVTLTLDATKKTKDEFNTAFFVQTELRPGEKLKPMILNAHNSRILRDLTGSPFIDDWNDVAVSIYVDPNVRFGKETVEGLRISPEAPRSKPVVTESNAKLWQSAIAAFKRDGDFDAVLERADISERSMQTIAALVASD